MAKTLLGERATSSLETAFSPEVFSPPKMVSPSEPVSLHEPMSPPEMVSLSKPVAPPKPVSPPEMMSPSEPVSPPEPVPPPEMVTPPEKVSCLSQCLHLTRWLQQSLCLCLRQCLHLWLLSLSLNLQDLRPAFYHTHMGRNNGSAGWRGGRAAETHLRNKEGPVWLGQKKQSEQYNEEKRELPAKSRNLPADKTPYNNNTKVDHRPEMMCLCFHIWITRLVSSVWP